jgi:hypothetical protein
VYDINGHPARTDQMSGRRKMTDLIGLIAELPREKPFTSARRNTGDRRFPRQHVSERYTRN